jgi:hypothetical protein
MYPIISELRSALARYHFAAMTWATSLGGKSKQGAGPF